jgi:hypothetical protein
MSEWTEERRQRQRELIMALKPWEKSTGPKTAKGKAASSRNSKKHGLRSAAARDIGKARTAAKRPDPSTKAFLLEAEAVLKALGKI